MIEQSNLKNDEIRKLTRQEMKETQGGTDELRLTFTASESTLSANKQSPKLMQFCAPGQH